MKVLDILFICFYLILYTKTCRASGRTFPDKFIFGMAASAYQYEGAWNESGKGLSIWDVATHMVPSPIQDNSTGDVACDSYHLYKTDAAIIDYLGLNFFRVSISWTRILPTGFANEINQAGIDHYNLVFAEFLMYGVMPVVTIYHWDLPQPLQELGGWANPNIVQWFVDYAKVVFDNFGDKVKFWTTINEPQMICVGGYGSTMYAPYLNMSGVAEYMCTRNLLLAHAKVYRLYDTCYRKEQNGMIGIVINSEWYEPLSNSTADIQAASDEFEFRFGLYAHPIYSKTGDYPEVVKRRIAVKSLEQGYPRSRLQPFTKSEVKMIQGTADYLGLNHYLTEYVYRNCSVNGLYASPSYEDDANVGIISSRTSNLTSSCGLYQLITKIDQEYDRPLIYITENGLSDDGGTNDTGRIQFMCTNLNNVLDALSDGCDVRGYAGWSLLDNFEWTSGYVPHYGIYAVDFSSPNRTRTPKKSAGFYKEVIKTRSLSSCKEAYCSCREN